MPSALIINDGSLAALVACAIERDRGVDVVAWVPSAGSGLSDPGFACPDAAALVRHQAAVLGFTHVVAADEPTSDGRTINLALLEATRAAATEGCSRVVWPIAAGDDLSAMARAAERVDLLNRLTALDEESGRGQGVEIVVPLVDLTPGQIDDLAADLDAPRHLCRAPAPGAVA
jgi:hypothetical protein